MDWSFFTVSAASAPNTIPGASITASTNPNLRIPIPLFFRDLILRHFNNQKPLGRNAHLDAGNLLAAMSVHDRSIIGVGIADRGILAVFRHADPVRACADRELGTQLPGGYVIDIDATVGHRGDPD